MELRAAYVRGDRLTSGWWRVAAHRTDGVDGARAEASEGDVLWTVDAPADERDLAHVRITPELLPEAPPLWFVHIDEPRAQPPAAHLVAYVDPVLEPGTVVTRYRYGNLGVPNDRQVAAVRWYADSGKVHQVFVAPAWRRRRVASALLYAADAVHQARGWPGHLHGDGKRTVLGQLLVESFRHPQRIALLEETMRPMDPTGG